MELGLRGKKVLVTGSTRGIGLAIASGFQAEGCLVAVNSRNQSAVDMATKHLAGSLGVKADVTDRDDAKFLVKSVVDSFGVLDILVCNVGSGASTPPGSETWEEWQRMMGVNLWSTINVIDAAKKSLFESNGNIVCISSICGNEIIDGAPITYSVAKSALNAYVKGISRPFGKEGVRINAVAPGNILFDNSVWEKRLKEDKSAVDQMLARKVSLGKLGDPEDVVSLALYLASERAAFCTGAIWTVDGGQCCF